MQHSSPTISVITPVWNGLPYIKECVESVLSQDFQDWEHIISDNGSTDGTREYLDTIKDPRVRIFKQENNLGIGGNLDFLVSQVQSPLVYILCADDYFYPGGLGRAVGEWDRVPDDTAFITFNWKETTIHHSELARYSYDVLPKRITPLASRFVFFLFGNVAGNLSNNSAKLNFLKGSQGFTRPLRQALDFELWAEIARDHAMMLSDVETAYVRIHKGAATNYLNIKGQQFAEHLVIYEKLIKELLPYVELKYLIRYFNIEIPSFHLREAIKFALHGRFKKMESFMETDSDITWPKWKKLILCLPFALSERIRYWYLIRSAGRILKQNKII